MKNLKTTVWKDADGKEYLTQLYTLYGCPIWVPIDMGARLDQQVSRVHDLLEESIQAVDQLQKIKELADQICGESFD